MWRSVGLALLSARLVSASVVDSVHECARLVQRYYRKAPPYCTPCAPDRYDTSYCRTSASSAKAYIKCERDREAFRQHQEDAASCLQELAE